MEKDSDIIKKKYGEKMARLCRELFPTLLEVEGLLSGLILSKFNPDHSLHDDLVKNDLIAEFKNYVYSFVDVEMNDKIVINKTPKELLDQAGYILYECRTEEEIQEFKRYYRNDEKLCTFNGDRLETNYVFFAIKKNVDDIKRENFPNPERQDEYGTSVISIQFTRGSTNTLSIKNRYNHTVNSPDATFSNNLDNIVKGLTYSFIREYNLNVIGDKSSFEIPGYVMAHDGKLYKYNLEINNIYYCPNNIIINGRREVERLDKSRYLLIDYFVIDLKKDNRNISVQHSMIRDCFPNYFKEKGIKNIEIVNIEEGKEIIVTLNNDEEVIIRVDKYNQITHLKNENITEIGNDFLCYNESLTSIELPRVQTINNCFLFNNKSLLSLELPQVKNIGNFFHQKNEKLTSVDMPEVQTIGSYFLCYNENLTSIEFPQVLFIGKEFLYYNEKITTIKLPRVQTMGCYCLYFNKILTEIELPESLIIGSNSSLIINDYLERMNNEIKSSK